MTARPVWACERGRQMILGFVVKASMLVFGGLALFAILLFQILQGKRKIKFKGPLHMKVHKAGAWVMLAASVFHGFLGMVYAFGWRIG